MGEFAVFTEEIAMGLMARGFELTGRSEFAWFFEDSVLLQEAVGELVAAMA